jgi:xylulokinase
VSVLLGLDVGTGGARAVAVDDTSGEVVAEASASYPLSSPQPGWSEQDPEDWWRASKRVLGEIAGRAYSEIVGLGLTGQMHGSVFFWIPPGK